MMLHDQMLLTYKHITLDLTNGMYKHESNQQTNNTQQNYIQIRHISATRFENKCLTLVYFLF